MNATQETEEQKRAREEQEKREAEEWAAKSLDLIRDFIKAHTALQKHLGPASEETRSAIRALGSF